MKALFKFLFIFFTAIVYGQWVNIGLISKSVTGLATYEPAGLIYAVADNNLYKTNNFGQNWTLQSVNGIAVTTVAVDKPTGKLFIGTSNGMYISNDNAQSFSQINTGLPGSVVYPAIKKILIKDGIIAIATNAGVYKSALDSINWTNITYNLPAGEINAIEMMDDAFYVGLGSGLYRSTSNNNWEKISDFNILGLTVKNNNLFLSRLGCYEYVYKSTDKGNTWNNVSTTYSSCNALTIANKGNELLIGFFYGSAVSSLDNGNTWTPSPIGPWTTILNFESYNEYILAGTEYYSYMSNSGGVYYRFNSTLGTDNKILTDNKLAIYPNPSQDFIFIDTKSKENKVVKIYSISGQLVNTVNSRDSKITINVRDLQKGTYIVELKSGNVLSTQKLIKK